MFVARSSAGDVPGVKIELHSCSVKEGMVSACVRAPPLPLKLVARWGTGLGPVLSVDRGMIYNTVGFPGDERFCVMGGRGRKSDAAEQVCVNNYAV